jgi:hypothetical protein
MHGFRHLGLLPQNAAAREKAGLGWALIYECRSAASIPFVYFILEIFS